MPLGAEPARSVPGPVDRPGAWDGFLRRICSAAARRAATGRRATSQGSATA